MERSCLGKVRVINKIRNIWIGSLGIWMRQVDQIQLGICKQIEWEN